MSFGLVEVITLLLGLSNFSLQANPKAPTADVALQYAMPDADVVVHFDAASVIPNNYKALTQLANQPQIKSSPQLSKMVREAVAEVEGLRGLAKTMTGIDLATDLNDATMFIQLVPRAEPNFVAAVRGKFTVASVEKIGKALNKQSTKIGAGVLLDMGGTDPSLAITKDGVLLAGTTRLLRDRLADTWKAPVRAPGSGLAHAADVINAKPIFAVSLTLSATARKVALDGLGPQKNFITDAIQRHKTAAFGVFHDGIGWTWQDSTKAGMDAMAQMSEGTMELMRAAHIAPRGMAKILLGAIESYRGVDKNIDELIARKADVMKIVESYTGDGNFKVKIDKNPTTFRLDARATGKSLSEVVPAGFVMPAAAFFLLVGKESRKSPAMVAPPPVIIKKVPAPPPPRPTPPAPRPAPPRP